MSKAPSRRDRHRMAVRATKPAAPGPKFAKERKHKRVPGTATWPSTPDQRAQSRPVIWLRPLRAIRAQLLAATPRNAKGQRVLSPARARELRAMANWPKHALDRIASF